MKLKEITGWTILKRTLPLAKDNQIPIYWTQKAAMKDAIKYNCRAVEKVKITWVPNGELE